MQAEIELERGGDVSMFHGPEQGLGKALKLEDNKTTYTNFRCFFFF